MLNQLTVHFSSSSASSNVIKLISRLCGSRSQFNSTGVPLISSTTYIAGIQTCLLSGDIVVIKLIPYQNILQHGLNRRANLVNFKGYRKNAGENVWDVLKRCDVINSWTF